MTAAVIGAVVPAAAFWDVLVRHTRSFYAAQDNSQAFFPWFEKLAIALHHGYLPFWDAGVDAGYSFAGEVQTAIFYPINLAVVAAAGSPSGIALWCLELLVVLHYVIAYAGMYVFLRRLRVEGAGALVGALLFAYTGPHASRAIGQIPIFASYSLVPLAAFFAVGFARNATKRSALFAGAVMGCEILAGHIAAPLFSMLICLALIAGYATANRPARSTAGLVLMSAALLVVASPQLALGYQHALTSYRISGAGTVIAATARIPFEAIDYYSLPATGLLGFFVPGRFPGGNDPENSLFMGGLPIVVMLLALATRAVRASDLRLRVTPLAPLYALGLLSLLIAIGGATPFGRLWYALPVVGTLVREPARFGLVFQFALCTLVAELAGAASVVSGRSRTLPSLLATAGAAAFAGAEAVVLATFGQAPVSAAVAAFSGLAFVSGTRALAASLVAAAAVEAVALAHDVPLGVDSPQYAATLWSPSPVYALPEKCFPACRVSLRDPSNRLPINLGDVFPLQVKSGYTALIDERYQDFLSLDWSDGSYQNDLLNVRYILATEPLPALRLVDEDRARSLYLYERASVFPRVYSLAAALGRDRSLNDVRFSTVHYDDLRQVYDVDVPRAETVVFSEQFYPGWSATVDRTRAPLLVAKIGVGPAILRAVSLPRGEHVVAFSYPSLF